MVSNPYDDGTNGPEDDNFDDLEFVEDDFSHEGYEEGAYDLEGDGDAAYADGDFGEEEWDEDIHDDAADQQHLYQSAGLKKGLSFNAIVIIGAVVVGGAVMLMTVKNKSSEVSAGNQNFFQSMLNIGGVMDGMLLGDKEKVQDADAHADGAASGGFLNDPSLFSSGADSSPPQPTPMAPQEDDADYPLTAMPDGYYDTPRGPDEQAQQADSAKDQAQDTQTAVPLSAEDLLKQALANREKKQLQTAVPKQEEPADPVVTDVRPAPLQQPEPVEQVSAIPAPAVPAASIGTTTSTPVNVPVPDTRATEALTQNTQAMEALGSRMEKFVDRIDSLERNIKSIQASGKEDYNKLEKTITALQTEVQKLKDRPAAVASAPSPARSSTAAAPATKAEKPKAQTQAPPKTATPVKKAAPAVPPARQQAAATAQQAGNWELRAAQPGRAWVSRSGSRDMQSVEVGQTLPGIGRITAISYQAGRWIVAGTQGQIRQ